MTRQTSGEGIVYAGDSNNRIVGASARVVDVRIPEPDSNLAQDEEWILVRIDDEWQKMRLHDYADFYSIPGLYERVVYDTLQCQSPTVVARLLESELAREDDAAEDLRVLDLGAGNGCVAEALSEIGISEFVGIDICREAPMAAERDRPGLYRDYVLGDMTDLADDDAAKLQTHDFNCMVCVAALGFSDIPPAVFLEAYNLVQDDGWVAFTIKSDFLSEGDGTGFSRLVRTMDATGALELMVEKEFIHRIATDRSPLPYVALVGRKRSAYSLD